MRREAERKAEKKNLKLMMEAVSRPIGDSDKDDAPAQATPQSPPLPRRPPSRRELETGRHERAQKEHEEQIEQSASSGHGPKHTRSSKTSAKNEKRGNSGNSGKTGKTQRTSKSQAAGCSCTAGCRPKKQSQTSNPQKLKARLLQTPIRNFRWHNICRV